MEIRIRLCKEGLVVVYELCINDRWIEVICKERVKINSVALMPIHILKVPEFFPRRTVDLRVGFEPMVQRSCSGLLNTNDLEIGQAHIRFSSNI